MELVNKYSLLTKAVIVITLLSVNSCAPEQAEEQKTEKLPVRIMKAELTTKDDIISFTGIVQPWEEAHVGSGVPAKIERILVDVDDYVQKGQLLAQMDRTQLYQAEIRVQTLKDNLRRLETLKRVGAVTQQNYEQVKAEYDIAKSSLENLKENTQIYSPLTGVVTGRYFSDGEIFSMTPGPAGKPAIVSILQVTPVKVIINVSEKLYPVIERRMFAEIGADMYPGKNFSGYVERIHPVIDRATGTFKVEIRIPNEDRILRPGMYVRVGLNLGEKETFIVPSQTVLRQSGSNERYVFVEKDGIAIRRTVQIGERMDDMLEIREGLKPGENLIVSGQHNLLHNQKIRIVK